MVKPGARILPSNPLQCTTQLYSQLQRQMKSDHEKDALTFMSTHQSPIPFIPRLLYTNRRASPRCNLHMNTWERQFPSGPQQAEAPSVPSSCVSTNPPRENGESEEEKGKRKTCRGCENCTPLTGTLRRRRGPMVQQDHRRERKQSPPAVPQ